VEKDQEEGHRKDGWAVLKKTLEELVQRSSEKYLQATESRGQRTVDGVGSGIYMAENSWMMST